MRAVLPRPHVHLVELEGSAAVARIDVKRSIFPVPMRVRMAVSNSRKRETRKKRSAGAFTTGMGGLAAMAELLS